MPIQPDFKKILFKLLTKINELRDAGVQVLAKQDYKNTINVKIVFTSSQRETHPKTVDFLMLIWNEQLLHTHLLQTSLQIPNI